MKRLSAGLLSLFVLLSAGVARADESERVLRIPRVVKLLPVMPRIPRSTVLRIASPSEAPPAKAPAPSLAGWSNLPQIKDPAAIRGEGRSVIGDAGAMAHAWDMAGDNRGGGDPVDGGGFVFNKNQGSRREEEKKLLHQPWPTLDYRRPFNKEEALRLADWRLDGSPAPEHSGRKFFELLTTEEHLDVAHEPDAAEVDFGRFGRSDGELRPILEKADVPFTRFEEWRREAYRFGLIYILHDHARSRKAYYGVPKDVREVLGLPGADRPAWSPQASSGSHVKGAKLGKPIIALAKRMEGLPEYDEMSENMAILVQSARSLLVVDAKDIPSSVQTKIKRLMRPPAPLDRAVLGLLDAPYDKDLAADIEALCRLAVSERVVDGPEMDRRLFAWQHGA